jgi:hypothetical protein
MSKKEIHFHSTLGDEASMTMPATRADLEKVLQNQLGLLEVLFTMGVIIGDLGLAIQRLAEQAEGGTTIANN